MKSNYEFEWKGVMPAVTTQFDREGNLDLNSFEKNLLAQINAGVHGLILGGTLGEASTLNEEEKLILLKKALKVADNKVPVILNIAEQSTDSAIRNVKNAEKNGANGLMVLPPMRYKATEDETIKYFSDIANSTSLPIMIYNNPIDYKIEITLDMLDKLKGFSNINAVKESTRDITNITRMINRFGNRFSIFCGVDTIAMESLVMGAHGWVAGLVDAYPEETMAIYTFIKSNKIDKALKIYRWFLPLLELDISPQLVQNIKQCEVATSLGTGYVRKPRMSHSGEERKRIQKIIEESMYTRPDVSDYKELL